MAVFNTETAPVTREACLRLVKETLPDLDEAYYPISFDKSGIDSIELTILRAELELLSGQAIPDQAWVGFDSLDELIAYCAGEKDMNEPSGSATSAIKNNRHYISVNMPQMAIEALSENWLFKELGARHWEMLCAGLKTPSLGISDDCGNRLYATFVRIRMESSASLAAFKENDRIELSEQIKRAGSGMYFSDFSLQSPSCSIRADLMTSFSARNSTDNTRLTKSQPFTTENNIPLLPALPEFANEYRQVKKNELKELRLCGESYPVSGDAVFQTEYAINPYYDINGAGLLYFAAYPIINDVCEARFFNKESNEPYKWETSWFTMHRDIFYYGNCNFHDQLQHTLHFMDNSRDGIVRTCSSLSRKSDEKVIARIFTCKKRRIKI